MNNELQGRICLNRIEKIEDLTGKMFHEVYPELAEKHIKAMDNGSKLIYLANQLSKIIDELGR